MPAYMVTYDKRPGVDYEPLITALKLRSGVSPAESVWFVLSLGGAKRLRDELMSFLAPRDRLLVIEMPFNIDWATLNAANGGADWLDRFVSPGEPAIPQPRPVLGSLASLYR